MLIFVPSSQFPVPSYLFPKPKNFVPHQLRNCCNLIYCLLQLQMQPIGLFVGGLDFVSPLSPLVERDSSLEEVFDNSFTYLCI
ncbi:hypothetical protein [Moorena sp. SIO4G3]|uniref:hypothetical protein n=1 Tax=Moorena sp. SIO4G3 TaxID=2607821 RepID=UPI00142C28A7|nr:hypothetical protein [Moorena sp. SIO4G3]NEO78078.1 hypothetical protein [Moorena sp. SIO4G3]